MSIDLACVRRQTPGCRHVLHLENAGSSLMPEPVLETLRDHLELEARLGGYEAARRAAVRLEGVYAAVARLLNCHPDEVALVESATVAWDMAFYSLARTFRPGDRVLTVQADYASNYIALLQAARHYGIEIRIIPDDACGQVDVAALEALLDERVKLICVTHVPTNGGLVNPAAAVGRLARRHGIPYLLDACQSAGQLPLDVTTLGCDFLSATGRKFLRGPRGTGFLYVRRERLQQLEPPLPDLHAARWTGPDRYELRPDARRFETWEHNLGARLGLGTAVDYALDLGLEALQARVQSLAGLLREELARLPGMTVQDRGRELCGIVSFTHRQQEPETLRAALAAQGIQIGVSTRSSTLLDMTARRLDAVARASPHYYNSEEELERFLVALKSLL